MSNEVFTKIHEGSCGKLTRFVVRGNQTFLTWPTAKTPPSQVGIMMVEAEYWKCFSYAGTGELVKIAWRMNGANYCKILVKALIKSAKCQEMGQKFIFSRTVTMA